jgi:hypothetical protein
VSQPGGGRPSEATVKRLFAVSGNQCAHPGCETRLVDDSTGVVTAEICHIKGHRPGSARYDAQQSAVDRHAFENLMLFCSVHHKIADTRADLYPVQLLLKTKAEHEAAHAGGLEPSNEVVTEILRNSELLQELLDLHRTEASYAEERDRPRFEAQQRGVSRLQNDFKPQWHLRQVSGDPVANVEWRYRGPHFGGEWRHASGSALDRTAIADQFDLTAPLLGDDRVEENELGLETRVHWRGKWRHQLHRYPIAFRETQDGRVLVDIGREILPVQYFDED